MAVYWAPPCSVKLITMDDAVEHLTSRPRCETRHKIACMSPSYSDTMSRSRGTVPDNRPRGETRDKLACLPASYSDTRSRSRGT